jgi:3-oxoacyl-[acyl-carrier protein] reductase
MSRIHPVVFAGGTVIAGTLAAVVVAGAALTVCAAAATILAVRARNQRRLAAASGIAPVILVTGGSRGLGLAISSRFATKQRVRLVLASRHLDELHQAQTTLLQRHPHLSPDDFLLVAADLSTPAECDGLVTEAIARFGRIDVLVNNAGLYTLAPIGGLTAAEFHRQFDTNVFGLLLATKTALPLFPESGGSIVNISSVVSTFAPADASIYVGTKGAVDSITKTLAKELAPKKIRVNSVNPGFVITEGTHAAGMAGGDFEAWVVANSPLGRAGQPEDVAASVAFLASSDASWITGETLRVAGGTGM